MSLSSTTRPADDRCPGVLRPYVSGDGTLVRLRAPGGHIPTATLSALARYAATNAAPVIQLTSRGNLQLRGLPDPLPADLEPFVIELGLLPSSTHEVMRNIIASPFEATPVAAIVTAYDEVLRADPTLARLPGRWLVAIDDGSGDVMSTPWDVSYQASDPEHGIVRAASSGLGRQVTRADAAAALIEASRRFVAYREPSGHQPVIWNARELSGRADLLGEGAGPVGEPRVSAPPSPGAYGDDLLAGVPLGMLEQHQAELLTELAEEVVLTPWRSVLVPGAAAQASRVAGAGLVVDAASGFTRVTACVGAPHCARTGSPTLQIARGLARDEDVPAVHVSGCDRRCGHPAQAVDVINPADLVQARALIADLEPAP